MIDMVAQNPEQAEISGHHDQAQDPGHESRQNAEERSDRAGADGHDPGNEGYAAGDGVEDHGSGEAVGGTSFDLGELDPVYAGDNMRWLITNVAAGTPVR